MRVAFALLLVGCSSIGAAQAPLVEPFPESTLVAEARIRDAVAAAAVDIGDNRARVVLLERADGRRLRVEVGSPVEPFITSSTAKPIISAIALDYADRGLVDLDETVGFYLPGWATVATGAHATTTVRDLMRFTGSATAGTLCERERPHAAFLACVEALPLDPANPDTRPNGDFRYAGQQLNVLSAVLVAVSGLADYQAVADEWSSRTGLFPSPDFYPNSSQPSGAISMEVTAEQYLDFLGAVDTCSILSDTPRGRRLCAQMQTDQIPYWGEPTRAEQELGEDWHFGFGMWLECRTTAHDCAEHPVVSTFGRGGQYGLIDRARGIRGYIGPTLGPDAGSNGLRLYRAIEPLVHDWARLGAP